MPDPDQPLSPQVDISPQPPIWKSKRIYIPLAIILGLMALIFLIPLNTYLAFQAVFNPKLLQVGSTDISWDQLKKELELVTVDKHLKTRQHKLQRAMEKVVERELLRQVTTTSSAATYLTLFEEYQARKRQVEQNLVNLRTGGYFIARFKVPQATQSADGLKQQAKSEIDRIKKQLDEGQTTQKVLSEAMQNTTLRNLNGGAFLPGTYLEKVTEDEFPLKIKSFREKFFSLGEHEVSNIITLSWDDYEGLSYDQEFKGEFAYAVVRIDQVNPGHFDNYNTWLASQKEKIRIVSHVYIPFFFKWF